MCSTTCDSKQNQTIGVYCVYVYTTGLFSHVFLDDICVYIYKFTTLLCFCMCMQRRNIGKASQEEVSKNEAPFLGVSITKGIAYWDSSWCS